VVCLYLPAYRFGSLPALWLCAAPALRLPPAVIMRRIPPLLAFLATCRRRAGAAAAPQAITNFTSAHLPHTVADNTCGFACSPPACVLRCYAYCRLPLPLRTALPFRWRAAARSLLPHLLLLCACRRQQPVTADTAAFLPLSFLMYLALLRFFISRHSAATCLRLLLSYYPSALLPALLFQRGVGGDVTGDEDITTTTAQAYNQNGGKPAA
jgi:hypothetical protein